MPPIGDRAYADPARTRGGVGRDAAEGLLAEGVMTVIKQMPGTAAAPSTATASASPGERRARPAGKANRFLPFRLSRPAVGHYRSPPVRAARSEPPFTVSARGVKEVTDHIGSWPAAHRRPLHAGGWAAPWASAPPGPWGRRRRRGSQLHGREAEDGDICRLHRDESPAAGRRFDAGARLPARIRGAGRQGRIGRCSPQDCGTLPKWDKAGPNHVRYPPPGMDKPKCNGRTARQPPQDGFSAAGPT